MLGFVICLSSKSFQDYLHCPIKILVWKEDYKSFVDVVSSVALSSCGDEWCFVMKTPKVFSRLT